MAKQILVTGGLGFIGSHTVVALNAAGYEPIILDNLSNSQSMVFDRLEILTGRKLTWIKGDVNDARLYESLFRDYSIEAVIHFAAFKAVGESVEHPLRYYRNNVGGLISLLEAMEMHKCDKLVFSSSCTVYGEPLHVPVSEQEPLKTATSPYGATKQMGEEILQGLRNMNVQSLRYFNPVGAHPSALIGELPLGVPNNLVPYLTQTVAGIREQLTIHGGDYPTPDGTCIRDYIHVLDLAEAHVLAVKRLLEKSNAKHFEAYNIGTGKGVSVLELIHTFERVNRLKVNYTFGPRRAGDVVQVWADASLSQNILGWKAERTLEEMMHDAWNWQQSLTPNP